MIALRQLVFREIPLIEKIVQDETWLEGERRNCWVSRDDPVVRANVCEVILRIGAELRAAVAGRDEATAGELHAFPEPAPNGAPPAWREAA